MAYTADRKLWLTADKDEVVEDGDSRAAFLLASPGDEVPDEDAKRYGIKAAPKPADKAAPKPADKGSASGVAVTKQK